MLVRFVRSRFAAPLQFVLTLAVLIPASARPSFAEVKGVQPILLHCWSADSRNAMVNTISTHATRIAIGSAPYLPSNRGCNVAAGADRLANLKRAIQDLRHAGIEVDVIIHLANIHQTTVSSSLASQFLEVWTGLIVPYKDDGSVRFYISGSLEDQYTRSSYVTDGFVKMASALSNRPEDKKTLANLVATNRFFFHRSPNGNGGDGNLRFKTVLMDVNVPVTHERHGSAPDNSLTQQGGPSPTFRSPCASAIAP